MSFEGKNILEVWDYRLSTACPMIDRSGGTWVVKIFAKDNLDYSEGAKPALPLETHDTGIQTKPNDAYDTAKVAKCYEWLLTVRDKYALPNIEELKPIVKKINKANAELAAKGAA